MVPLLHDNFYHIYNRGNNHENLFLSEDNYIYFLEQYIKHVTTIAETYTWVLMRNHFHFLVRIKSIEEINRDATPDRVSNLTDLIPDRVRNPVRDDVSNPVRVDIKSPHLYFSNLFNSYTQAFNKMYNRSGALFNRPFKRVNIASDAYLRNLVLYIHTNPVHHGFTDDYINYPWSGYQSIVDTPDRVSNPVRGNISNPVRGNMTHPVRGGIPNPIGDSERRKIINWFNDIENFKVMHQMKINTELLSEILLE